jgi:putative ABC transport system permease protein
MLSYALKEIRRRKLRSVANVAGYAIAVAFLIILVTLSQGYTVVANGTLKGIGTHFAAYIPATKVCESCLAGEVGPYFKDFYTSSFNLSIVESVNSLPGVADAAPALFFRLTNLTICGIEPADLATTTVVVSPDEVVRGRFLDPNDAGAVMVDQVYASVAKVNVGDKLAVFNRSLTVVGIVNPGLHSKPAGTASMYANLGAVQEISRYYGGVYGFAVGDTNLVLVEISAQGDSAYISSVEKTVLDTVELYGAKDGAIVGYQCGYIARDVASINETSAWVISAVLLVSTTLFALKSQFSAIIERTKEFGILKAIGWTNSDITGQVFLESLLQGIAGGIIGTVIGCVVVLLVPLLRIIPTQNLVVSISPTLVLLGLGISIGGGIIAGIVPAWQTAKLQPSEALRRF